LSPGRYSPVQLHSRAEDIGSPMRVLRNLLLLVVGAMFGVALVACGIWVGVNNGLARVAPMVQPAQIAPTPPIAPPPPTAPSTNAPQPTAPAATPIPATPA